MNYPGESMGKEPTSSSPVREGGIQTRKPPDVIQAAEADPEPPGQPRGAEPGRPAEEQKEKPELPTEDAEQHPIRDGGLARAGCGVQMKAWRRDRQP